MKDKAKVILSALSLVLLIICGFLFIALRSEKSNQHQLAQGYQDSLAYYKTITTANSLLFERQYDKAMNAYHQADNMAHHDPFWRELAGNYIAAASNNDSLERLKNSSLKLRSELELLSSSTDEMQSQLDSLRYEALNNNLIINNYAGLNKSLTDQVSNLKQEIEEISKSHEQLVFSSARDMKVRYYGETANNKANGFGIGIFDSKAIYEGEWKNNVRDGKGKYTWANGDIYEGDYVDGKREGYGIYLFASGEKYKGEWKNDVREGKGVFYSKDGEVLLDGNWENDKYLRNKSATAKKESEISHLPDEQEK